MSSIYWYFLYSFWELCFVLNFFFVFFFSSVKLLMEQFQNNSDSSIFIILFKNDPDSPLPEPGIGEIHPLKKYAY